MTTPPAAVGPSTASPLKRAIPRFTAPPPLESGDRLTRREFERRYRAISRLNKAELVEGIVHMPSPVQYEARSEPHSHIIGWLKFISSAQGS